MNWETIDWSWNETDSLKALMSLLFGFILGLERELKEKAAGLRTITIIALGSTLFTLMSYKIGLLTGYDTARIASYVVSGIGFLGAGVIFKDGITINGLTTASIIWMAAAIGMSIGFGQFSSAVVFLITALFIIYFGNWFNKQLLSKIQYKTLEIHITNDLVLKDKLLEDIHTFCIKTNIKQQSKKNNLINIILDIKIKTKNSKALTDYLTQSNVIIYFKI